MASTLNELSSIPYPSPVGQRQTDRGTERERETETERDRDRQRHRDRRVQGAFLLDKKGKVSPCKDPKIGDGGKKKREKRKKKKRALQPSSAETGSLGYSSHKHSV